MNDDDCVYATRTNDPLRTALEAGRYAPGLTTDEVLDIARRMEWTIVCPPDLAPRFAGKGVTVRVEGRRSRPPFLPFRKPRR